MKKMGGITILTVIFLIIIFCHSKNNSELEKNNLKKTIMFNLEKIENTFDFNYLDNKYYKNILNFKTNSISPLVEIINDSQTPELQKYLSMLLITNLTNCDSLIDSPTNYTKANDFYKLAMSKNCHFLKNNNYLEKAQDSNIAIQFNKYPDYLKILHESKIKVPSENLLVPQGLTIINNFIFITAYHENNLNSVCYILNISGKLLKKVELDITSHVGGLAYDEKNKLIWLPDNKGIINAYNFEDFFAKSQVQATYRFSNLSEELIDYQNPNSNVIDYLTIYDNHLYIGNFSTKQSGIIKKFLINKSKSTITLKYIHSFKIPAQVQGITFYKNNNQIYFLLSTSYGRKNPSFLHIYKYEPEISDYTDPNIFKLSYKLPPLLEQITVNQNWLYALFESNAPKYSNCFDIVNSISVFNLDFLIKDFLTQKPKSSVLNSF